MKVLESQSGLRKSPPFLRSCLNLKWLIMHIEVSNHEVLALIRSSSDTQPQAKTHRKKKTKEFEDLNTIDYTVSLALSICA